MISETTTFEELEALLAKLGVTQTSRFILGTTHVVNLRARPAPGCMRPHANGIGTSTKSGLEAWRTALEALDNDLAEQAHYAKMLAKLEPQARCFLCKGVGHPDGCDDCGYVAEAEAAS